MKRPALNGLILTVVIALLWALAPEEESKILPLKPTVISQRERATASEKRNNKQIAREYSKALGYTRRETRCLIALWTRESRFDHLAKNRQGSSAYGIAQLLRERSSRPELQVLHGLRYLSHRYSGSACRALSHHHRKGWY